MSNKRISFAKIIAEQEAKKAEKEANRATLDSFPKKEMIETDMLADEKVQAKRNLAPKLKQVQQVPPFRVYPANTKVEIPNQNTATENGHRGKQQEAEQNFPRRRASFEERYKRVTTYLENDVYEKVQELYESGEIVRINKLVNMAVKLHLQKFYEHESKESGNTVSE